MADMLRIVRTVADVVTMCAGKAVPSSIGPIATARFTERSKVYEM